MKQRYYLEFPDSWPVSKIISLLKEWNVEIDKVENPVKHLDCKYFVSVISDPSLFSYLKDYPDLRIFDNQVRPFLF